MMLAHMRRTDDGEIQLIQRRHHHHVSTTGAPSRLASGCQGLSAACGCDRCATKLRRPHRNLLLSRSYSSGSNRVAPSSNNVSSKLEESSRRE
jgi:hypothetical protein